VHRLIDILLPRWKKSKHEKFDPHLHFENVEQELPTLAKYRTDKVLPKSMVSRTDASDATLIFDHILNELPNRTAARTEIPDENSICVDIESL
jgi:hypothetical protein